MIKKTTPAERKAYIHQQRAKQESYKGSGRVLPVDMSFIDREGNIVRPTRDNPYPTRNGYSSKTDYHSSQKSRRYAPARRYHGVLAIVGILAAIFFLSPNITGNAIANLTNQTTSTIGAGLLLVSLVAGLLWLNNKK